MKIIFNILLLNLSAIKILPGDGYPFDPYMQELRGDTLRFQISSEQIEEISAKGLVTFSPFQLQVIHKIYPHAKPRQKVIAATFNDNRDDFDDEFEVDCFWLRADQIALTIDFRILEDPAKSEKALTEVVENPDNPDLNVLRLSPSGKIYHIGKLVDLQEAFKLIAAQKRSETSGDHPNFSVVVPPPYRPEVIFQGEKSLNALVQEIYSALEAYGESSGVPVSKAW